jgi:Fic-DOC domain mobile mystery protein B
VKCYLFKDRDGQTPLPIELRKGLRKKHITTIGELDEYEEDCIAKGLLWLDKSKQHPLDYIFWIKLHKKLFDDVWKWAGDIRKHELANPDFKMPHEIWPELKYLVDDIKYWIENNSYPFKEIAARFHERIETIHPFPNGNGRFGRILIEYFCKFYNEEIPSWGASRLTTPTERRKKYIESLDRARHSRNYADLIREMYT